MKVTIEQQTDRIAKGYVTDGGRTNDFVYFKTSGEVSLQAEKSEAFRKRVLRLIIRKLGAEK